MSDGPFSPLDAVRGIAERMARLILELETRGIVWDAIDDFGRAWTLEEVEDPHSARQTMADAVGRLIATGRARLALLQPSSILVLCWGSANLAFEPFAQQRAGARAKELFEEILRHPVTLDRSTFVGETTACAISLLLAGNRAFLAPHDQVEGFRLMPHVTDILEGSE